MKLFAGLLLFAGVAIALACSAGLLVSRTVYGRLHFVGPASVLTPLAIAGAVVVTEGLSQAGIKAVILALIFIVAGPLITHGTARAAYRTEHTGAARNGKRTGSGVAGKAGGPP